VLTVDVKAVDCALVSGVEGSSGVGRISDEAVDGVGHLVTQYWKIIHCHGCLVLSVDALVCDQAGRRDHVCGHTITNEEDDVLGLALLSQVANDPVGCGSAAIVVGEGGSVLARLVKSNTAVCLGRNIDASKLLCVTSEQI
jgi:hypothetical protein